MKLYFDRVGRTKIVPPQLRVSLVARERLLAKLRAAVDTSVLTLLSAPAGSGKTTLLVSLVHSSPKTPFAWVSLDENDNDPAQFLTSLLACLEAKKPNSTPKTQALLASLDQIDLHTVFNALINDAIDHLPDPFTIILDDIHFLTDQSLLRGLDYLVERAPSQMRFLMAGRHAPALSLARLRARRQLSELKLDDLSFTLEEVQQFYQQVLGLPLNAEYMELARSHTQGWAAGVALLGSSMEQSGAADVQKIFTPLLHQTSRFIFDFLTEEIINQEQPATRAFLLKTSVLPELTAGRCAALVDCDEAKAGEILEDLYRRHIFLTSAYPGVYRYHDLFANFLYDRLLKELPGQVKLLHRKAAGMETNPLQQVSHYMRAGDSDAAAQVVESGGDELLEQGAYAALQSCMQLLPEKVRAERTLLLYYSGICASQAWDLISARSLLQEASARLEVEGDPNRLGTALLHLATCLSTTGDLDGARRATEKALTCPLQPQQTAHLRIARAWQRLSGADWQGANADLDAVLDLMTGENQAAILRAILPQWHYLFSVLPGGIGRMERYVHQAMAHEGENLLRASGLSQSAWVHLWRGDWLRARQDAEEAQRISSQYGLLLWVDVDAGILLPQIAALEGDLTGAEQGFQALYASLSEPRAAGLAAAWMPFFHFNVGRTYWLNDRMDEARAILERMKTGASPYEWQSFAMLRDYLQAMLYLSEEKFAEAEAALLGCLEAQNAYRFTLAVGSANLLLAYLYWRRQLFDRALACLEPELARCEQEATPGFLRWVGGKVIVPLLRLAVAQEVHASFARKLLAQMSAQEEGVRVPDTGEPLTPREVDVLRLIASGASNADIAQQLVISIHTVKIHVAHLLDKLNVETRQAAAARARDLGIS